MACASRRYILKKFTGSRDGCVIDQLEFILLLQRVNSVSGWLAQMKHCIVRNLIFFNRQESIWYLLTDGEGLLLKTSLLAQNPVMYSLCLFFLNFILYIPLCRGLGQRNG